MPSAWHVPLTNIIGRMFLLCCPAPSYIFTFSFITDVVINNFALNNRVISGLTRNGLTYGTIVTTTKKNAPYSFSTWTLWKIYHEVLQKLLNDEKSPQDSWSNKLTFPVIIPSLVFEDIMMPDYNTLFPKYYTIFFDIAILAMILAVSNYCPLSIKNKNIVWCTFRRYFSFSN